MKISFWNHWEKAVLSQILPGSLLGPNFCNLRRFSRLLKLLFGIIGNGLFGSNPGREHFGAKSWHLGAFQPAIEIAVCKETVASTK